MNILVTMCRRWQVTPADPLAERGSATIFVVAFSMVLFAGAGLAIDGGRIINERDKATDVAEQAARAGADQLDQGTLRDSQIVRVDHDAAIGVADDFVKAAGYAATPGVGATERTVTVHASKKYKTVLLSIVGINEVTVTGTATASQVTGATK